MSLIWPKKCQYLSKKVTILDQISDNIWPNKWHKLIFFFMYPSRTVSNLGWPWNPGCVSISSHFSPCSWSFRTIPSVECYTSSSRPWTPWIPNIRGSFRALRRNVSSTSKPSKSYPLWPGKRIPIISVRFNKSVYREIPDAWSWSQQLRDQESVPIASGGIFKTF